MSQPYMCTQGPDGECTEINAIGFIRGVKVMDDSWGKHSSYVEFNAEHHRIYCMRGEAALFVPQIGCWTHARWIDGRLKSIKDFKLEFIYEREQ